MTDRYSSTRVSVVAGDLAGYSQVIGTVPREGDLPFLNETFWSYSESAAEHLSRQGLTPIDFSAAGDGFLALFSDADIAAQNLLELQTSLDRYRMGIRNFLPDHANAYQGMTGLAVVTSTAYTRQVIGDQREPYRVLGRFEGPALVRASRLAALSRPGRVIASPLVDEATKSLLQDTNVISRTFSLGRYVINEKSRFTLPAVEDQLPSADRIFTILSDEQLIPVASAVSHSITHVQTSSPPQIDFSWIQTQFAFALRALADMPETEETIRWRLLTKHLARFCIAYGSYLIQA